MEDSQAAIKIARRNINNLRYENDTTLMAESEVTQQDESYPYCLFKDKLSHIKYFKGVFEQNLI